MKTSYFTVVLTLTCLLGLGIGGHAQDAGRVIVKVPFEFIAGGHIHHWPFISCYTPGPTY